MFLQALNAALRILIFRAGPQDFPYSPQLPQVVVPLAVLANYLVFAQLMPAPMGLVMAAASVGGLALVVRGLLRARALENRYNQTINALLLCTAIQTALLALPLGDLIPALQRLSENPELIRDPEALGMPRGAAWLFNLIYIWNFAITVFVFRQAANIGTGLGLLLSVFAAVAVAFFAAVWGGLAGALLGIGGPAK